MIYIIFIIYHLKDTGERKGWLPGGTVGNGTKGAVPCKHTVAPHIRRKLVAQASHVQYKYGRKHVYLDAYALQQVN